MDRRWDRAYRLDYFSHIFSMDHGSWIMGLVCDLGGPMGSCRLCINQSDSGKLGKKKKVGEGEADGEGTCRDGHKWVRGRCLTCMCMYHPSISHTIRDTNCREVKGSIHTDYLYLSLKASLLQMYRPTNPLQVQYTEHYEAHARTLPVSGSIDRWVCCMYITRPTALSWGLGRGNCG